ncbi:MAG: PHP domain-containing protein [Alphaproteobacteria bacterium]
MLELLPNRSAARYYRGNLHGHSNHSDGQLTPEQVVATYKSLGYDFTCLSDHLWIEPVFCAQTVLDTAALNSPDFVTIPSAEIHCLGKAYDRDGLWHIVANGLPLDFASADETETGPELVSRAIAAGAFVTIAHPEWHALTTEEAASISHAHGVEIYNHSCHIECMRGGGTATLDFLLQEGRRMMITATDDSHFRIDDGGGGWVMVAAESLTATDLLAALKQGAYYSSSGADFNAIWLDGDVLEVRCSPVSHICVSGRQTYSMSRNGENLTAARFDLKDFDSDWFRVTLCNRAGQMAWSNPHWR